MRFYLDNDVDVAVAGVLVPPHDCWTTADAGRHDASDRDQALYAQEHQAAIVTHDAEFTRWRKQHCIGQHIRLCVLQPDGPEVLARHLDDVVGICGRHVDVVIEVHRGEIRAKTAWDI